MPSSEEKPFSYYIGWCVLLAAASKVPLAIAGLKTMSTVPGVAAILLMVSIPMILLLSVAGVGLVLGKSFGFYTAYATTLFGSMGGLKTPFLPFVSRLNIGPRTEDLFLVLNLVLIAILVWEHLLRLRSFEPREQKLHRTAMLSILFLGGLSIAYGQAQTAYYRGTALTAAELPVVGPHLGGLKTAGPISFTGVETKGSGGINLSFSGTAARPDLLAFAESCGLNVMTNAEAHRKFLPQTRRWNLDPTEFPVQFPPDAAFYIGRPIPSAKVVLQIVHRTNDSRFTAELMGILPRTR